MATYKLNGSVVIDANSKINWSSITGRPTLTEDVLSVSGTNCGAILRVNRSKNANTNITTFTISYSSSNCNCNC